ncbi:MAG: 16S rRNA (adenine(1518)-N(6)/adenine(1519)-N(6))-dimethyltransferase RsmA [Candidatus Kapabacteria bacterium]|nr:16S rRNA (adenine(1518)-N(6)/adenine(1519)-N(6))-dimethyltransferase RsmA [Candidatus Kapabacteria bacterium]
MQTIQPKKSLGQNFLIDKNISRKIVSLLDISINDITMEIGPGTGALTELLLEYKPQLTAIEIDKRAFDLLHEKFPPEIFTNFSLVHSDIRDFDISSLYNEQKIKSIGNIPYYISADILFRLFENSKILERTIIMVQKEVAKRIVSQPNTKDYGILGVAAGFVADSKIMFDVPGTCFYPRPNVTSSVVKIQYANHLPDEIEFSAIMKFVKAAFSQRRKTLKNSLKQYFAGIRNFDAVDFEKSHEQILQKRAEALCVNDFITLYQDLTGQQK